MRPFWYRLAVAGAILSLSLFLLAINIVFEITGSVPDYPDLGFLAGGIPTYLFLYPFVCFGSMLYVRRRLQNRLELGMRRGGLIGILGSALYCGIGLVNSLSGATPPQHLVSALASVLVLIFVSGIGGALGAAWDQRRQLVIFSPD
ncbi:MAG: hypothetical protein ABJA67_16795 [Chthonomonadales bacterium]